MEVFTFYVGQGNLGVLVGDKEAIVVDAHMPSANDDRAVFVKAALADAVARREVRGLILTGFDADHADPRTVAWVLHKYHPRWVMYPKYFKDSGDASGVFDIIGAYRRTHALRRIAVRVDLHTPELPEELSDEWSFDALSPHVADMTSSNNSSLVLRVEPWGDGGFAYLITGDTEIDRWESIRRHFAHALPVDVLAAPHHGSANAMDEETLELIDPQVVLISAGIDNQFDHPRDEVIEMYNACGADVHSTHEGDSLLTYDDDDGDLVTVVVGGR